MQVSKVSLISDRFLLAILAVILTFWTALPVIVSADGGGKGCDVNNNPIASFTVAPSTKVVGSEHTVTLDGSRTYKCDPNSSITDYMWDFGDGVNTNGMRATHTYSPGTYSPSLTVIDDQGRTDTRTYNDYIIVKESNSSPVLQDVSLELVQDSSLDIDVSTNGYDPDGDNIQFGYFLVNDQGEEDNSFSTQYGFVSRSSSTGLFYYSSYGNGDNEWGVDQFSVGLRDEFGGVAYATVTINVIPRIYAAEDSATTIEGESITIPVTANDFAYNNQPYEIHWTWADQESGGYVTSVDSQAGTITFTPDADFVGTAQFEYGIKSLEPDTWYVSTTFVYIDVQQAPNSAPIANNDTVATNEDAPASFNVLTNDHDPDGDAFTIQLLTNTSHGSVNVSDNGQAFYTPSANYFGTDSFTYQLIDTEGNVSDEATVTINVNPVNDAPVASNDSATVAEDESVTIAVMSNDYDIDSTELAVSTYSSAPSHGTVTVNGDGTITYVPTENFFGTDQFTYKLTDDAGAWTTATVSVQVSSVNDAPVAQASWSANAGGRVTFDAGASYDLDGSIVSYEWDFGDGSTSTQSAPQVTHKYKNKNRTYTVTLIVSDNNGAQTMQFFTISN